MHTILGHSRTGRSPFGRGTHDAGNETRWHHKRNMLPDTTYSSAQCIGSVVADGFSDTETFSVVRNPGGGTSQCCSHYPVAAPAGVSGRVIQIPLLPRSSRALPSRNGARVYLANKCVEGDFTKTTFAAVPLLGRTLSITVDISAAQCGCNAAWYLVNMAQNTQQPGTCGGDYYCDANVVCGVRCAEIDLMEVPDQG